MSEFRDLDRQIVALRGPKNRVRSDRPYAFFNEQERTASGIVETVSTLFLVNRECPLRCLMCDLWKNTLDETISPGMIPQQIEHALEKLGPVRHVKLYNSANFFDPGSIPRDDYAAIAERVRSMHTVIVENHPRLMGDSCEEFAGMLEGDLEIAMGLETIHPRILPQLNKRMTVDDFARAATRLGEAGIHTRAFVLLRPPGLEEDEGIEWALRSIDFAFAQGTRVCTIIPTRGGNGMLDQMQRQGRFHPPRLRSLERAQELALQPNRGRVFVDLWDAEQFSDCLVCADGRIERIRKMNELQRPVAPVECSCELNS